MLGNHIMILNKYSLAYNHLFRLISSITKNYVSSKFKYFPYA